METKKETAVLAEGVSHTERSSLLSAVPKRSEARGGKELEQKQKGKKRDKSGANETKERPKRHPALRAIFWTLRRSIVPLLFAAALIGGMYVGYAVLGKRPGADVFHWDTWKHMYDLVFADS